MAADNKSLGCFDSAGHSRPPGRAAVPQIEVTFDIDANAHRQRHRQGQGHQQGAADPHPGLGRPVGRRRPERWSRTPKPMPLKTRSAAELIEARNQGDALVRTEPEKAMAEHGDKVDASQKQAIEPLYRRALKEAVKARRRRRHQGQGPDALAQAGLRRSRVAAMYKASQVGSRRRRAGRCEAPKSPTTARRDADFEEVGGRQEGCGLEKPPCATRTGSLLFIQGRGVKCRGDGASAATTRPWNARRCATIEALKSSYRKLAMKFHPGQESRRRDRRSSRFKEISEASRTSSKDDQKQRGL